MNPATMTRKQLAATLGLTEREAAWMTIDTLRLMLMVTPKSERI